MPRQRLNTRRLQRPNHWLLLLSVLLMFALPAGADVRDQAKRLHDRLAGVPPTPADLDAMLAIMDPQGSGVTTAALARQAALDVAMQNRYFYSVTLKNWITPWTNEERTPFAPLNDFTATVIGVIASDNPDFRRVLYDDILYVAANRSGIPAYSPDNNAHYAALEASDLHWGDALRPVSQASQTGLPSDATAGVLTTRAAAKAFFVAGTNRAMLRFTLLNFLCKDMEQLMDVTRPADRIRQDVSRSPGGDSRIFLNNCVGCHSGMDPLAQAFAYYNWTGEEGTDGGRIEYTAGEVQPKYHINDTVFRYGYRTPDDGWTNYWRKGPVSWIGWDATLPGEGQGARSLGQELANSDQFATCQVEKVFRAVCLRTPESVQDGEQILTMTEQFKAGYDIRQVFADSAVFCMGD